MWQHFFLIMVTISGLTYLAQNCGRAPVASVQSLENLAAGREIKRNACRGTDEDQNSASVAAMLTTLDGPADKSLRDEVRLAVSAVPHPYRALFVELGGHIKLAPDTESLCSAITGRGSYFGGTTGNEIDGCYLYDQGGTSGAPTVTVVVKSSPQAIRHALVREFGYLFAQHLSKLRVSRADAGQISVQYSSQDLPGFAARKTAVANAFLTDLSKSSAFNLSGLSSLVPTDNLSAIPAAVANGSTDIVATIGMDSERQQRLKDFIFAEAFDSFYCNPTAAFSAEAFASLESSAGVDANALSAALKTTDNSRLIMAFLFPSVLDTFNRIHAEMFVESTDAGLQLTGFDTCTAAYDFGTGISPMQNIFGNAGPGTIAPPSQSFGALATSSQQDLGQGTWRPAISPGNQASFGGASGSSTLAAPTTASTVLLNRVDNIGSGAGKNFDTLAFKQPLSYPEQPFAGGFPPAMRSAVNTALAYTDTTVQPVSASSAISGFALGAGDVVGKVCRTLAEGSDDAAKLAKLADASALAARGANGAQAITNAGTAARRLPGAGFNARGDFGGGGVVPTQRVFPSPDGFSEDLAKAALGRRAELHRNAIEVNGKESAPDGVVMFPGFAKDNAIHTNRIVNSIAQNGDELSKLGLDVNRMKVGAAWHDVGKTDLLPREQLVDVMVDSAKRSGQTVSAGQVNKFLDEVPASDQFMVQRIMLHEFHSIGKLDDELTKLGYRPEQIELLKRDVLWHNDGGKQAGTFWQDTWHGKGDKVGANAPKVPLLDYGKPQTKEGAVLTFFDRVDQASVDPRALTGGPFKIAANVEGALARKGEQNLAAVVQEAFVRNPDNTQRQIDALMKDNPFLGNTDTYRFGMQRLGSTREMANRFEFGSGEFAGKVRVRGQSNWASTLNELKAQLKDPLGH